MKLTGNYLAQPNKDFPLDAETLAALQENIAMSHMLGAALGDKYILNGCELESGGTSRTKGHLFVCTRDNPFGEVVLFEGGSIAQGMHLRQEDVLVQAPESKYPKAYTLRTMVAGVGEENYSWGDFSSLKTPTQLQEMIEAQSRAITLLSPPPVGMIQMWAGLGEPNNYLACDGRQVAISDFPALYTAIGTAYNTAVAWNGTKYSTAANHFRVPDLRGRFVVGLNALDAEYSSAGATGGEKRHALTVDELPAHDHKQNLWAGANGDWRGGGNNSWPNATSHHNKTTPYGQTDKTGSSAAHENRPPYYTVQYIIRAL